METNVIILFVLIIPAVIMVILALIRALMPFSRYAFWYDKNRHWFAFIFCLLFLTNIILFS
nr:MAG TPA: Picornaviridae P3A protein [Caudoviricetes sp.]